MPVPKPYLLPMSPAIIRILVTMVTAGLLAMGVGVALVVKGASTGVVLATIAAILLIATWTVRRSWTAVYRDAEERQRG